MPIESKLGGLLYITVMRNLGKAIWILLFACVASNWAADSTEVALDTAKNNTFGDIDIFGQSAIGSVYILWDNVDIVLEIKKSIQEKSFATDEFFMQNIDREEFEEERILKLFDGEKSQYFKLFPGALEEEDKEDEDEDE
jgi:hypothetical protein